MFSWRTLAWKISRKSYCLIIPTLVWYFLTNYICMQYKKVFPLYFMPKMVYNDVTILKEKGVQSVTQVDWYDRINSWRHYKRIDSIILFCIAELMQNLCCKLVTLHREIRVIADNILVFQSSLSHWCTPCISTNLGLTLVLGTIYLAETGCGN